MMIRRRTAVVLAAGVLTLGMATMAMAATSTTTQTVTAGTRTASVANVSLTGTPYSHVEQTSSGTMALSADDSTGSGDGWDVTVQSSAFVHEGTDRTADIAATNFALTSAATPVAVGGQAIDATGGPKVPTTSPVGTLDTVRKVVQADATFGKGSYTQNLEATLTIPAQSLAGTYTGTLTTTITAAP